MAFRFVHTADVHLDLPLSTLALRDPMLAELIGGATRKAFVAVIDLCLSEQVDALLIAGDLYDGEQTSMKTARFLADQLRRLHVAGIATFVIRGNHDAEFPHHQGADPARVGQGLRWPRRSRGARPAARSTWRCMASASRTSTRPRVCCPSSAPHTRDAVNIGMLHTSLGGSPAHDRYAPCSPAELHGARLRPLGARPHSSALRRRGQGDDRDAGQSARTRHQRGGAKVGDPCDDRRRPQDQVDERLTSVAEFQRVLASISPTSRIGGRAWRGSKRRWPPRAPPAPSEHLVARLKLDWRNAARLAPALRTPTSSKRSRARSPPRSARPGSTRSNSTAPRRARATAAPSSDPIAELRGLMETEVAQSKAFQDELRDLADELRGQLPTAFARRPVRPATRTSSQTSFARIARRGRRGRARTLARRRSGPRRVRIARLDLTRYGRFSDYSLDFGAARPAVRTSTSSTASTRRASRPRRRRILDLLFGIEKQSTYGVAKGRASVPNWHAYNTMRIGARLELDGRAHEVARLKRGQEQPRRCERPALRRKLAEGGTRRGRPRSFPHDVLARRREPGKRRRGDPGEPRRSRAVVVLGQRGPRRDQRPARRAAQEGRRVLQVARIDHRTREIETRAGRAEGPAR